MEGDFNAAMKIFTGAWMTTNAIWLKLLPDACYGSCPGCMSIQVLLNCTLTADVTQQSWVTLAVVSVDCQTCYDSLAHPPLSIACQCLGANPTILKTIFSNIQHMHFFFILHMVTLEPYGGPTIKGLPFQGVCQGNVVGLALWLAISIPLLELVCQHSYVSSFVCLVSHQSILFIGA